MITVAHLEPLKLALLQRDELEALREERDLLRALLDELVSDLAVAGRTVAANGTARILKRLDAVCGR
jgi:hypothetical protein